MKPRVQTSSFLVADRWTDYELLDCGSGMKQERWGPYTLVRPDPQIVWPGGPWTHWDGLYHRSEGGGGDWEFRRKLPAQWELRYDPLGLRFKIKPTSFKHTGLFPEQAVNWEWVSGLIRGATDAGRSVSVLNLFGYTGAATCAAAKAGAAVCHVDAAAGMVAWCRENLALCGLGEAPVRTIADDCLKFVGRERRRGRKYEGIILDPPAYGRGSSGEMWKLEENLWGLLEECQALLADQPLFFLLNTYTARLSPIVVANLLSELFEGRGGETTAGEIGLPVTQDGKVLPCGVYGRWQA